MSNANKESVIERNARRFAKDRGVLVMKLSGSNQRGQPDRMFLRNGVVLFIEFKRKGEKPTPLQQKWLDDLTAQGFTATWCDNLADAQRILSERFP